MNIHISREGREFGPYPIESLAEMIRKGNVLPGDLLLAEGQSRWVPVSAFLEAQTPPPVPPVSAPPPVLSAGGLRLASPGGGGGPPPLSPPVADGGTELEQQVLAGGRFVLYQYCVSILVMTFKRPASIVFLRGDEDGAGHAFTYSLISLVAGWWGFPWGPIWTITTLVNNLRGGTDVTQAVLIDKLGAARAARIMAQRKKPAPRGSGMKLLRWGFAGAAALLVLMVGLAIYGIAREAGEESGRPLGGGETEFRAANSKIDLQRDSVSFGNSPQATRVADRFSETMSTLRNELFEGGKTNGVSLSGHQFLTYCELHDSQCAIIVHVPELRRFTDEAKDSLGELAWIAAHAALQEKGAGKPGMSLAVGLRGIVLYDRVLLGQVLAKPTKNNPGIAETVRSSRPERRLYSFFESPNLIPVGNTGAK